MKFFCRHSHYNNSIARITCTSSGTDYRRRSWMSVSCKPLAITRPSADAIVPPVLVACLVRTLRPALLLRTPRPALRPLTRRRPVVSISKPHIRINVLPIAPLLPSRALLRASWQSAWCPLPCMKSKRPYSINCSRDLHCQSMYPTRGLLLLRK